MEESKFYKSKNKSNKTNKYKVLSSFITKVLICLIIFITLLIVVKANPKLKEKIHDLVYENHFSFSYINNLYQKYFGKVLPFENIVPNDSEMYLMRNLHIVRLVYIKMVYLF